MSSCNLKIFLCISIEKREPRIIPRSRPSASTSKRTSASLFSILIHRKIFKLHSDKLSKHFVKTMREGKYHFLLICKLLLLEEGVGKSLTHLVANCSMKIQQFLLSLVIIQLPFLRLYPRKS